MLQLGWVGSMVLSNSLSSLHLCLVAAALLLSALAECFDVIWNAPSAVCKRKFSIDLELDPKAIGFNANHSFNPVQPGDKIVLFYEQHLGLYPWLKPIGEHTYAPINGGVPQAVNLTAHLLKVGQDVALRIPDPDFDGLAVIDWEDWRFLYEANWGSKKVYKLYSKRLIANSGGAFAENNLLQISAEQTFNSAAKKFVLATLKKVKELRPKAKWGFYMYPECHWGDGRQMCSSKTKWMTLQLLWLYREVDAIYPSLYFYESSEAQPYQVRFEMVASRVAEAYHARGDRDIPIYGYVKIAYDTYKEQLRFYTLQDQCLSFLVPHLLSLDGVILWSSYHSFTSAKRCLEYAHIMERQVQGYLISLERHVKLALSDLFWLADENCAISQMCLTPSVPFACLGQVAPKEELIRPFLPTSATDPPPSLSVSMSMETEYMEVVTPSSKINLEISTISSQNFSFPFDSSGSTILTVPNEIGNSTAYRSNKSVSAQEKDTNFVMPMSTSNMQAVSPDNNSLGLENSKQVNYGSDVLKSVDNETRSNKSDLFLKRYSPKSNIFNIGAYNSSLGESGEVFARSGKANSLSTNTSKVISTNFKVIKENTVHSTATGVYPSRTMTLIASTPASFEDNAATASLVIDSTLVDSMPTNFVNTTTLVNIAQFIPHNSTADTEDSYSVSKDVVAIIPAANETLNEYETAVSPNSSVSKFEFVNNHGSNKNISHDNDFIDYLQEANNTTDLTEATVVNSSDIDYINSSDIDYINSSDIDYINSSDIDYSIQKKPTKSVEKLSKADYTKTITITKLPYSNSEDFTAVEITKNHNLGLGDPQPDLHPHFTVLRLAQPNGSSALDQSALLNSSNPPGVPAVVDLITLDNSDHYSTLLGIDEPFEKETSSNFSIINSKEPIESDFSLEDKLAELDGFSSANQTFSTSAGPINDSSVATKFYQSNATDNDDLIESQFENALKNRSAEISLANSQWVDTPTVSIEITVTVSNVTLAISKAAINLSISNLLLLTHFTYFVAATVLEYSAI